MRAFAAACALLLASVAAPAAAAPAAEVPYVPTPQAVVDAMLGIAKVGSGDHLIDLGSGDGRIVIAAATQRGASGFGVEIDGALVSEARREAQRQGVADRAKFGERNLFLTDISGATVLTMYLLPSINMQLRPRLFSDLRPGTRVVSHDFDMENWRPDERITVPVPDKPYGEPKSEIYLWIIPANAAGTWHWRMTTGGIARDYTLQLAQRFQMLAGSAAVAGGSLRLQEGRVRGEQIEFVLAGEAGGAAARQRFRGRISGDEIRGIAMHDGGGSGQVEWHATRSARGRIELGTDMSYPGRRTLMAEERK